MKFRRLALAAIMALTTLSATLPSAHAATILSVGLAYDTGGPGDHSFDDAVAAGITAAKKRFQFDVTATVTIGTDEDRELRLRSLVAKGCNPVIAVGSGYAVALQKVALSFPDHQFVIVNDATVAMLNVTSLVFAENQGGYLAGTAAALVSTTGKIGMIGSSSQTSDYESGFKVGALAARKGVAVDVEYGAGSWGALTKAMINRGADVIFLTTSGSASDVFGAVASASNNGKRVGLILVEPDQYVTVAASAKKYILASVVKRVDRAIVDAISEATFNRTITDVLDPAAGIYGRRYGIQNKGIELSLWSPRVSKYRKVINVAAQKAGKL